MTRRIILVDIGAGLTLRGVLPSVALFADYTASLVASGGQAPYSYSLAAGALPDGLALDAATGIISGTAGVAGQSVFTVRVTDLSGAHVDRQFAITVIAEPLSLSGAAPAWTVGTPYSYTYSAAHGVPPYSWSLAAGALPAGLALNAATGEISGTPTAGNAPAWTVRVTDSAGTSIDLRDNATLQLLGDFADATVGTAYSSDLLINGGAEPYSNSRVTVGALPAGLALSVVGDKLRLSGTPTAAATSNFTAAVDSADGQTAASVQSIPSTEGFAVLSASDKAPEITITSDLTATRNAGAGAWKGVRATKAKSSGKWYFEVKNVVNGSANGSLIVGVAEPTDPLTYPGAGVDGNGFQPNDFTVGYAGLYRNGSYFLLSDQPYAGAGGVAHIAVDFDLGKIWFRNSSTEQWAGGGSPSVPSSTPTATFPPGTTLCPMIGEYSAPQQATANFGATAFAGVVPSGFHAGWF